MKSRLQFGHGNDAVETAQLRAEVEAGNAPLQFGHGNDAVETVAGDCLEVTVTALQFGHGNDAVETPGDAPAEQQPEALQFGHGNDAVETLPVPTGRSCRSQPGFNSATAMTPWKHGNIYSLTDGVDLLQFGH